MNIEKVIVGPLETNCYLVWDEEEAVGVVIDPGGDAELIISKIRHAVWQPLFILLTHGHADHIAAILRLKEKFPDAKVVIHKLDAPMLGSDTESLGILMGIHHESIHTDKVVENRNVISVSPNLNFQVLHTPGHTPGGVCFYLPHHRHPEECSDEGSSQHAKRASRSPIPPPSEEFRQRRTTSEVFPWLAQSEENAANIVFSGDTLFKSGIGRTDLPGGGFEEIQKSLRKLSKFPGNTLVYPGHGEEMRIGDELRNYS